MAQSIDGLDYHAVTFGKDGHLTSDEGLKAAVAGDKYDQVFFFAHGWNEGVNSAQQMFKGMFSLLAGLLGEEEKAKTAAVGVFWPSLLFPDDTKPPVAGKPPAPSSGAEL